MTTSKSTWISIFLLFFCLSSLCNALEITLTPNPDPNYILIITPIDPNNFPVIIGPPIFDPNLGVIIGPPFLFDPNIGAIISRPYDGIYYDIHFSSPPNIVGQAPITGIPVTTPSYILFGQPIVSTSLGALHNQPLVFNSLGNTPGNSSQFYYDQIVLNMDGGTGFYYTSFDIVTQNLIGSRNHFVVLFDTPTVENITFQNDGYIDLFYKTSIAYQDNQLMHFEILMNIANKTTSISINGNEVYNGSFNPGQYLGAIRFSHGLRSGSDSIDCSSYVGIDNIIVADHVVTAKPAAILRSIKIVGPNSVPEESDTQYQVIGHYDDNSTSAITADANLTAAPDEFARIDSNGLLATERLYRMQETCTIRAAYKGFSASKPVIIYSLCDGSQCTKEQLLKRDIADVIKIKQGVMDDLKYAMKIERTFSQLLMQIDSDKKCKGFNPGQLTKARIQILAALMWEQWANGKIDASVDSLEDALKNLQEPTVEKPKCLRK
jgi:hypothetical protein